MTQLRLLILLLLVSFKGISQTDTIKKIVLNEKVAREVVKDLVRGDVCRRLLIIKDEEIKNLQEQNDELVEIMRIKDSISEKKDKIIKIQDKAIGWWKKPELHGYLGVQTIRFDVVDPYIYGRVLLEYSKLKLGGQYFVQPNRPSGYGVIVEYKVF
jgi:hypothetical protein